MMRRVPLLARTPLLSQGAGIRRKAPKKRAGYHAPKYLAACRKEACYLALRGICCGDKDTVVPCHANWAEYGKGGGIKARDIFTVPGCWRCHAELDQGSRLSGDQKRAAWERAYARWQPVRRLKLGLTPGSEA